MNKFKVAGIAFTAICLTSISCSNGDKNKSKEVAPLTSGAGNVYGYQCKRDKVKSEYLSSIKSYDLDTKRCGTVNIASDDGGDLDFRQYVTQDLYTYNGKLDRDETTYSAGSAYCERHTRREFRKMHKSLFDLKIIRGESLAKALKDDDALFENPCAVKFASDVFYKGDTNGKYDFEPYLPSSIDPFGEEDTILEIFTKKADDEYVLKVEVTAKNRKTKVETTGIAKIKYNPEDDTFVTTYNFDFPDGEAPLPKKIKGYIDWDADSLYIEKFHFDDSELVLNLLKIEESIIEFDMNMGMLFTRSGPGMFMGFDLDAENRR